MKKGYAMVKIIQMSIILMYPVDGNSVDIPMKLKNLQMIDLHIF